MGVIICCQYLVCVDELQIILCIIIYIYIYLCIWLCIYIYLWLCVYIYINASLYLKNSRCRASLKAAKWQVFLLKNHLKPNSCSWNSRSAWSDPLSTCGSKFKITFSDTSEFFGTLSSQLFWGQWFQWYFFPGDLGWLGQVSPPWGLRRKRRSRSWRSWTWGRRGASATPNSWPAPGSTAGGIIP